MFTLGELEKIVSDLTLRVDNMQVIGSLFTSEYPPKDLRESDEDDYCDPNELFNGQWDYMGVITDLPISNNNDEKSNEIKLYLWKKTKY